MLMKMTLNFWSSCFYLQRAVVTCSVGIQTQSFTNADQVLKIDKALTLESSLLLASFLQVKSWPWNPQLPDTTQLHSQNDLVLFSKDYWKSMLLLLESPGLLQWDFSFFLILCDSVGFLVRPEGMSHSCKCLSQKVREVDHGQLLLCYCFHLSLGSPLWQQLRQLETTSPCNTRSTCCCILQDEWSTLILFLIQVHCAACTGLEFSLIILLPASQF